MKKVKQAHSVLAKGALLKLEYSERYMLIHETICRSGGSVESGSIIISNIIDNKMYSFFLWFKSSRIGHALEKYWILILTIHVYQEK